MFLSEFDPRIFLTLFLSDKGVGWHAIHRNFIRSVLMVCFIINKAGAEQNSKIPHNYVVSFAILICYLNAEVMLLVCGLGF